MKWVSNVKSAPKMASNIVFATIGLLTVVEESWGSAFSHFLPESWYPLVVGSLSVLGVVARLIDQGLER